MKIVKADPMADLMTRAEVEEILNGPYLMRLGFVESDGSPAVAPIWVIYQNDLLWATIETGSHKARRFEADNRVYFTIDHQGADGTFGVRGPAKARVLEADPARAEDLVRQSLRKYMGSEEGEIPERLIKEAQDGNTAVVEITPAKYACWRY